MKRFRPIRLGADIVCVLTIALFCTPAQAKQCAPERPSDAQAYWSYRLIDGRKCWYEGRPGYSKSLLHWPAAQTEKKNPRREPDARPAGAASKYNPLDAQASITSDPDAQPKPETADRIAAPSKGNLTTDDLRAWGNSKLAAEPVLTIMDRWPDQELQQQRTAPAPAAQSSSAKGGRTALMVVILIMALSAVLMTTIRKKTGTWRLPFWPTRTSRKETAAWY